MDAKSVRPLLIALWSAACTLSPSKRSREAGVGGCHRINMSLEWSESSGKGNTGSERPCPAVGPGSAPAQIGWGGGSPSWSWVKHFRCEQLSSLGALGHLSGCCPPAHLEALGWFLRSSSPREEECNPVTWSHTPLPLRNSTWRRDVLALTSSPFRLTGGVGSPARPDTALPWICKPWGSLA